MTHINHKGALLEVREALSNISNSAVDCARFGYEMMVSREVIISADKTLARLDALIEAVPENLPEWFLLQDAKPFKYDVEKEVSKAAKLLHDATTGNLK